MKTKKQNSVDINRPEFTIYGKNIVRMSPLAF